MSTPEEHTLDLRAMAERRRAVKIEEECQNRIAERFPPYRQMQITCAVMALEQRESMDGAIISSIEKDASEFLQMMKCIHLHKMAARSLIDALCRPDVDPKSVNPSDDNYWPNISDLEDKAWTAS